VTKTRLPLKSVGSMEEFGVFMVKKR